ncbi:MAG: protein kinase [Planctomycetes bacterium]|nr:protein kinase [Planctomycetota bacterium]
MIEFLVHCGNPKCQQGLSCPKELMDKEVQCPKCGFLMLVTAGNIEGFAPGTRLGQYTVSTKIGEGSMGRVYEAVQDGLNRRVALKVLRGRFAKDPSYLKRFQREAQSAASLSHRNIVTVYEIVQDQGYYFFSMELVEGETLQTRLHREGRLKVREGLRYMVQAARGLSHSWEHKIIHRDIKPGNLMVTRDGALKIADLGLAKPIGMAGEKTTLIMGTPSYMSPEQARNLESVDIRADIYSLGATFYQAFTGQAPFVLNTIQEVITQLPQAALRPMRDLNPEIPPLLASVIEKMLARELEKRYQTPGELLQDLDQVRTVLSPGAGPKVETGPYEAIPPGAAEKSVVPGSGEGPSEQGTGNGPGAGPATPQPADSSGLAEEDATGRVPGAPRFPVWAVWLAGLIALAAVVAGMFWAA